MSASDPQSQHPASHPYIQRETWIYLESLDGGQVRACRHGGGHGATRSCQRWCALTPISSSFLRALTRTARTPSTTASSASRRRTTSGSPPRSSRWRVPLNHFPEAPNLLLAVCTTAPFPLHNVHLPHVQVLRSTNTVITSSSACLCLSSICRTWSSEATDHLATISNLCRTYKEAG